MLTNSRTAKYEDIRNYNRKNALIFLKSKLLSRGGWRGWPDNYNKDSVKIMYNHKKESNYNRNLHKMLLEIKERIKFLDYKQAKIEATPIIAKYKKMKSVQAEIDEIITSMKHIVESKYFTRDNDAMLMLFAEFNGSKRERYSREFDRILVTKSFRHLQYKTQIMVNSASDDQRTRLLHSLEVQRIAKTLATQLGANSSLAQTIAIGHDVGHTPFGHAGERALDKCLTDGRFGGFSHALQSVKVLNYVERHPIMERYGFRGLGISAEVLAGIMKHDTDTFTENISSAAFRLQYECKDIAAFYPGNNAVDPLTLGTLEAQIVYWADKIAYIGHDWEEFVLSSYLDRLLPSMNDIVEKIGEIKTNWDNKEKREVEIIGGIHNSITNMNQLFANCGKDKDCLEEQINLRNDLDTEINSLLAKRKTLLNESKTVFCDILSRSEYNMLFDYFEVAKEWMLITQRTPKKYKECSDIIYILYRFLRDTISQRTTPSLETLLIQKTRKTMGNKSAKGIIDRSRANWKRNEKKVNDQEEINNANPEWDKKKELKKAFMKALVVGLDNDTIERLDIIDRFKFRYYVGSKEVQHMTDQAALIIQTLFEYFLKKPEMLPDVYLEEYFLLVDGNYSKYRDLVIEYIANKKLEEVSDDLRSKCYKYSKKIKAPRKHPDKEHNDAIDVNPEDIICEITKVIHNKNEEDKSQHMTGTSERDGLLRILCNNKLAAKNKLLDPTSNHVSKTILARIIADYISSMTDRMAILKYNEIMTSKTSWTENYNA